MKARIRNFVLATMAFAGCAWAQWASEPGFGVVQQECMKCHDKAASKAPGVAALREIPGEKLYDFLTHLDATHKDLKLTDEQSRHTAEALSGRVLGTAAAGDPSKMADHCAANPPMPDPASAPGWNGWGNGPDNTRYQKNAGLTPDQLSKLKLKWAFGMPGGHTMNGQATVVGGRVFLGSDVGWVYSLDAKTGCLYWAYMTKAAMRNAMTVIPVKGVAGVKYGVYFGDLKSNAYGLDAQTGKQLWVTKVDDNYAGRITGAPAAYDGRVYVPLAKWESNYAKDLNYPCCTVRGSVTALDAGTGKIIWKHYVIPEPPKPTHKNSIGTQLYGPSGGSVWNTPAVDPVRGMIYFGSGEGTSQPAGDTTDSLLAVDIKTGKLAWHYQGYKDDAFIIGCGGSGKTENCPDDVGPDADIGASVVIKKLPSGKRMVIAGMKDGTLFAVDPDKKGALLWKTNVAADPKLPMAGITWGGAVDDQFAYYGLTGGGVVAVQLATGEKVWYNKMPPPPGRGRPGNSAAVTLIPGALFSAARTGILYALAPSDGHVIWEYDTAKDYDTVNKIPAHGGTIGSAGPVVAGGMLFVGSGYGFGGNDKNGNVLLAFGTD